MYRISSTTSLSERDTVSVVSSSICLFTSFNEYSYDFPNDPRFDLEAYGVCDLQFDDNNSEIRMPSDAARFDIAARSSSIFRLNSATSCYIYITTSKIPHKTRLIVSLRNWPTCLQNLNAFDVQS